MFWISPRFRSRSNLQFLSAMIVDKKVDNLYLVELLLIKWIWLTDTAWRLITVIEWLRIYLTLYRCTRIMVNWFVSRCTLVGTQTLILGILFTLIIGRLFVFFLLSSLSIFYIYYSFSCLLPNFFWWNKWLL